MEGLYRRLKLHLIEWKEAYRLWNQLIVSANTLNELELYTPLAYFRFQILYDEINLPNVSKEVTPSVTRAGIASGLIQKEIQDMTTMSAEGM